jgi:hypothetical protein
VSTIGLTVRDNPDVGGRLSLADTLAKGIFGDPEQQMKARAPAAQVAAHQAYATKLGADTNLVSSTAARAADRRQQSGSRQSQDHARPTNCRHRDGRERDGPVG